MDNDLLNNSIYGFKNEENFLIEKTKKSFWSSDKEDNQALFKKEKEFLQSYTDIPKQLLNNVANRLVNTTDGLVISMSMPPTVTKALSQVKNACPWHISISYDKNYLAILQDDSIVIVSKELDYDFRSQKVIKIDTDPFSSWRTIAWSLDSSLIAISYSHGQIKIYRLSDSKLIYIIQPKNHIKKTNSNQEGEHILLNKNTFNQNNNSKIGIIDPAVSLQFIDPKRGKSTPTSYNGKIYSYEILVINHAGTLRSYLFNVDSSNSNPITIPREGQSQDKQITFYHKFSFKPWLNIVVTSVVDLENNLLYLGGINKDTSSSDVDGNLNDDEQKQSLVSNNPDDTSFIIWKLTSSLPYYIKYNSDEKSEYFNSTKKLKSSRQTKWGVVKDYFLKWRHSTFVDNIIHTLALSPNKEFLLSLDFSGTVNLWRVKNEKLIKSMTADDLRPLLHNFAKNIKNKNINSNSVNATIAEENVTKIVPCAISWWSDSSIVLSFNNGWVGVINLSNMNNILGDQMELFNANPIVTNVPGENIIILSYSVKSKKVRVGGGSYIEEDEEDEKDEENEEDSLLIKVMENVIINPLSRFTDTFLWHFDNSNSLIPKKEYLNLIERQYSLFILTNTPPVEIFYHCIGNMDFTGALDLAKKYDLDTDYVYQAQWLSNNVSEKTISDYLSKINNTIWVIENCLDRIPSTPEDLLLLIEYGLKLTNLEYEVLNDPLFSSKRIRSMSIDDYKKFDSENLKQNKTNDYTDNLQVPSMNNSHSLLSPRKKYALSHSNSYNLLLNSSTPEDDISTTSNNNITDDFKQAVSLNDISSSSDSDDSLKPNYNCDICFYRLFLLKYLDRLKTYEEIMDLGNTHELRETFSIEFAKFRDVNLVLQCMLYAIDEKFDELRVLFTRHTEEILPYRMNILEYIPEAVSPNIYEFLLPEIENTPRYNITTETEDNSGEKLWINNPWRNNPDWVESSNIKTVIQWEEDVPEDAEPFVNIKLNDYPANTDTITQWYINRARSIEKNTGLIRNALDLIRIGIDKNVPNLESMYEDLITLSSLVYDCFTISGSNVIEIDLEILEKLNEQEIVNLFMKETNSKRVVDDVKKFVLPYLERLVQRWRRNNVYDNPIDLLSNYLRSIAKDHIEWCCLIVEASHPVIPVEQRIIKYDILLSHLIVDCSYLNEEENNLQYIRRMFNCIPALDSEMYQDMNDVIQQEIEELDDIIDRFDDHLASLELLEKYEICPPLSWFNKASGNSEIQRSLLLKLTRKVSTDVDLSKMTLFEMNNPKNKKYQEWETLWDDILTLREYGVLDDIPIKEIQADFVTALLNGGQFALAKQTIFDKDENDYILPHSIIEKLVIDASQEFFDNSESGSAKHGSMLLARECLQIIDPTPAINEELDLIDAVDILNQYKLKIKSNSDIPILPIQVRMCENRLDFIQKILNLDTNDYTKTGKLLDLSKKLLGQKFNIIQEAKIKAMIGHAAINHNNFLFAYETCKSIINIENDISEANPEIWKLFYRLAISPEFNNIPAKIVLIGHALSLCPPEKITDILAYSRKLEAEQLLATAMDYTNVNITDTESESILSHASSIKKSVRSFEDDEIYGKNCTTIIKHPFYNQSLETELSYDYGFYETSNERFDYVVNNNLNNNLLKKSYKHQILSNIFIRLEQIRKSNIIDNELFNRYTLINNDDIRKLALDYFTMDSEMTIACLFDLNEDDEIDQFFNKIHPSIYREQFACYFFALRCLYSWLSYENPDMNRVLHQYHPKSLIAALNDIVDIYENDQDDIDETGVIIYNEALKAKHYASLLKEKRQEYIFQNFFNENFINQDKFNSDEIYRERTLENLICTTNSEKIENILLLCGKYNIPTERMMLYHIKWVFTTTSIKQSEIEKCLLSCREVVKYYPNDVINTFNELHENINGNDILKLIQFYKFDLQALNNTVEEHNKQMQQNIENRIKLLSAFYAIETSIVFNIKEAINALYSGPENMKKFLAPLLTEKNINDIVVIMPAVFEVQAIFSFKDEEKYKDKNSITMNEEEIKSICYNSLILSMIQNEDGVVDGSLLTKSIPKIEKLLSNLSYSDLLLFITNTTTGKESKNLSIESRITLLDIALSYLQKENNDKVIDIISILEDIHSHLDLILLFKKLWDPNLKEYISHEWCEEFENIYNQPEEVPLNICSRMLVQGISPYLIYQTSVILQNRYKYMAMTKDEEVNSETFDLLNIYTKTLDTIIMTKDTYPLRALGLNTSEALFEDILDWIIYTTISYDIQDMEDKKWSEILNNGIFEYLKNVIANTESNHSLSNEKRRKLIEIFNRQFQSKISANTNITNILQSSKIQCILRDNWNAERSVEELNDEAKYVEIITYLLDNSQTVSHINAITDILNEWMFNSQNDADKAVKNTEEISEILQECWKLFILWMIDHQYYQKLFYLRLKYIKYDLLGSKNEKDILDYLKKNSKNYIYYLQNVMLTKESAKINSVIPDILKLLDAEKNNKKIVFKKKRVSLQPQELESGNINNDWNIPKRKSNTFGDNYKNNDNTNDWEVPLDLNTPMQEVIPEITNKQNVNGWDVPLDLDIPIPESKTTEIKPGNEVNGWDVPLDLDISMPEPEPEVKATDIVNGWDVPLDLNIPIPESKTTEIKSENEANGWDVPLDLDIPIPESKTTEIKSENEANGWDIPLDLNIPIPESNPTEIKSENEANGWDVPLDLDIPIPESKTTEIKSENEANGWDVPLNLDVSLPESNPTEIKPENEANGWDVPLDFDVSLPESNPTEIKPENKANGWDVPLDLDIPIPESKTTGIKSENEANGWDVPLNLDVSLPESNPTEIKPESETNGWDVPLDLDVSLPESESKEKEKPTNESTVEEMANDWSIPLDMNIENIPLSSSPKKEFNDWGQNENLSKPEIKSPEEKSSEMDKIMPLPDEYMQILETIKSDRNLHILICSRGFISQFIPSSLFTSLVQSVLTPISLTQSQQKVNHTMISHKFSEYHNLLSYIVSSLVLNGFINEAVRLVYFYMNNNDNKEQEIHTSLLHRYRLLKSFLKKMHVKISDHIKTQTNYHNDPNVFLRLNDQPQSIENAIIHEYMNLKQIKKEIEKAIEFIEQSLI
ncbi:hypothetical protein BCR36DRAFT_344452 [Piromyces finnis]|uniref:Sec39 domain-containing protein n=1 Tax=Piromyces finnis TaxID=1754191 RepID=A0A1Y1VJ97_9FUNG|nr:hypothetical protein BCR36DRAFT_344452 [Piromyces finnis]|eukprot:ORX57789.1 hypothetical protein BCR36DRAFT_344452 [Piromyces finnis]